MYYYCITLTFSVFGNKLKYADVRVCVFQCGALLCRSLPNIIAGAAPGRVDAAGKEEEKKQETEEGKE